MGNAFTGLDLGRPNLFYILPIYSYHRHGSLHGRCVGSRFLYVDEAFKEITFHEYLLLLYCFSPQLLLARHLLLLTAAF